MDASSWPARLAGWVAGWPTHTQVLVALACSIVGIELLLRRLAPRSVIYRRWTAGIEAVGHVWTAVILSIIYLVSVGPVSLVTRLAGRDLLDRSLAAEPSFWRAHEPNPLGALRAARHQF